MQLSPSFVLKLLHLWSVHNGAAILDCCQMNMEPSSQCKHHSKENSMKKTLLFLIAIVVLTSAFGFQAGQVKAASLITFVDGRFMWGEGVVFIFEATGYRNRDVRDTTIFVGSNFHDLGCTVNKEKTRIVCIGRGGLTEYAGQTGIIHLAGQLFYVTIPDRTLPRQNTELVCGEFEVKGAYVTFYYAEGQPGTEFIPGETLGDVHKTAQNWMDGAEGFITGFEITSGLVCGHMQT
jgi:hypothetical protein